MNRAANSGPSVCASSLVTDANSALSGGPHLQRSASINTESYMRLPASPMSFSSNNISISGSSVMDGSSIVQQGSHQDQSPQQGQKRQHGASTASSQPASRTGQVSFPNGQENTIVYWRKFVAEYFSPRAKKRWCLSLYDNVGQHALGVFPQATKDAWHCDICGSKSGMGFEATFEVLPRLNKVKFDSGVIDELLYLDMPRECRFPTGVMMLEYGKAVQESVFEQLRVVREGQLRIVFSPELKILSWEFCARRHEELLPRRMVAPQVNQLLQVAQKYQNAVTESGSAGVSTQDLQTNWNMFLTAGRQLARNMELPLLNDLGFSKRYVRCLQISEVVNSMKDLIDFSREHNFGPIESLKNYPRKAAAAKFQMQKLQEIGQQVGGAHGLPNDRNTLSNVMSIHPGLSNHMNNNNHMVGSGVLNTSAQTALALSNYQNLRRQNSMNSNPNALQQEASPFNTPIQTQTSPFQGHASSIQGSMQNIPVNGLSSPRQPQQQQQHPISGALQQNHSQSSQGSQNLQQHTIQLLLHEMMNNSGGRVQQQSPGGHNANGPVGEATFNVLNGVTNGGLPMRAGATGMVGMQNRNSSNASGGIINEMQNRNNSFKTSANINPMFGGNDSFSLKSSDDTKNLHLPELEQDITNEFPEWDV
ncbi:hypothetical protein IFM89_032845 [Coptis chinensis]|uniref:Transcriptional regulator SLK2 n=1 Tax=Coptis chinensis TaxID=261450 RepID=A0A835M264_9MAGN|nr:hypothetical protein IFM89_032845 [Coptis chinensis]